MSSPAITRVVYQAYGRRDIVQQALFSIASLKRYYPAGFPFEIRIYTDTPADLHGFFGADPNVALVEVSAARIQQWRGAIDFVHRVKLEILRDVVATVGGNLLYLDTDTIFRASPDALIGQISDSVSLMHVRESTLGEPVTPLFGKIGRFVKRRSFEVAGEPVTIPLTTWMWNAGVMGVSARNTTLLPRMIELTDRLYGQYRKHVMEQLAVSFYLQNATELRPADPLIYHYWAEKDAFNPLIETFLRTHPTLEAAAGAFDAFPWPPPRVAAPKRRKLFGFIPLPR